MLIGKANKILLQAESFERAYKGSRGKFVFSFIPE
jgi:hypothetical protein